MGCQYKTVGFVHGEKNMGTTTSKVKTAVKTAANKTTTAVKKAATAVKKDPIKATATVAKAVVGGVTGVVQSGISKVANSRLLKGTKAGTSVDLSNALVGLTGAWADIGIDAVATLASGAYQGKTVSELTDTVVASAKKSTKGNVDQIVDKTIACLKVYDPDITKQDLATFAKDLKDSAKAKLATLNKK
jgi:L-lactate utilization protein LutC